ncbi:MAG: SDR family oxidoreductase [Polyangiaceae bacterium]|nr:SDR family oxidoreductase [Polyangiaceae bacterium]
MPRPPIDDGVVLLTGASSGIGLELARLLAPRARVLALVARRKARLDALRDELARSAPRCKVLVLPADLSDRASTDAMLEALCREAPEVDVLINNAGFGDMDLFELADWPKTEQMLRLNIDALLYLTHRVLGGMVARRRGGVLNVSSGAGMAFFPGFAAYIGTKHFVTGFTEALRLDLSGTGVVVSQLCPGPVATEFEAVAGNFTGMSPPGIVELSAAACARQALRGFDRGRALIVPGALMWLVMWVAERTPRWVRRLVLAPFARALRHKRLSSKKPA